MNTPETQKKLDFLSKLLQKNPSLQKQFDEYMNDDDTATLDPAAAGMDTEKYINDVAVEFTRELETLNLDYPDWEYYTPRHSGYIPEYEAIEHMAEDMITEKFDEFKWHIDGLFSEAKADLALLSLVATYDACLNADIQNEYEAMYDLNEFLLGILEKLQNEVIEKFESMVVPNRQAWCFFQGLFAHYNTRYPDDGNFLRFFEPLLLCLIREKEQATYMANLIRDREIPRHFIPRAATEIYRVTGNREKWIKEAERLFEQDVEVAGNLLTEYIETSYDAFIRVAERLWKADQFRGELAAFILQHINRETSPVFYKEVLLWLTSRHRKVSDYSMLRNVLSKEEKEAFIQKHIDHHVFYIQMLQEEKRYPESLQFIQKNTDSWSFNEMVATILEIYPEESFELLKKKTLKTLETGRGRNVYKRVVEWLLLARNINGMNTQTNALIHQLYNWQPRLPALRDELKKAGIFSG